MNRSILLLRNWTIILLLAGIIGTGCGKNSVSDWADLVPDNTPFIILPDEGETLRILLERPYIPLFEDISSSAVQVTEGLLHDTDTDIPVKAILLYPDTSNEWQPIWITEAPSNLLELLAGIYQEPFTQNRYTFEGFQVEKLFISNRIIYAVNVGNYTVFSESSLGIEDMLRSHMGILDPIRLSENQKAPGSYIVNTSKLDRWVEQLAQVSYRPDLLGSFRGASPLTLKQNDSTPDDEIHWRLEGNMNLTDSPSSLIRAISSPSREINLDRYISINAAAFSIFRLTPRMAPPIDEEANSDLDLYFAENPESYQNIAAQLNDEVAFVAFAQSGFQSSSEFLFIRHVQNPGNLRQALNRLSSENYIDRDDNSYYVRSPWLGRLFGSELSRINEFYLGIYGNAVVISRRKGLTESVGSDSQRRRVVYYDDQYMEMRQRLPEQVSSLTVADATLFNSYIQPWLYPQNYFGALSSNFDLLSITTTREDRSSPVNVNITNYIQESEQVPYREQWIYSLGGAEISGVPVLANIGGSPRDEIIFATTTGSVFALASDGSIVTRATTDPDQPVGSPVVYDWYGNNQNVIMLAAGNKIYAWNEAGSLLPNFPVVLEENITTPLQVMDVTRNGVAEMIVATADRKVHILNSRGESVSGWPQTTNAVVTSKPLLQQFGQQRSVFAFSENSLHAWNINGIRRDGFPVFIDSQFMGSPTIFAGHILGSASDGNLYSVGEQAMFADTLAASSTGDSLIVQGLNVSNSSLNSTPSVQNLMIRVDDTLVRENLILLQSSNGSVFLFNTSGELRFTQSMGQPGSDNFSPVVLDINSNNRMDVVSLAGFGRLYAWDLISGERIYDLPTTGLQYPLFADLNRDGNMELIAQTREGLRTWTIYPPIQSED